MPRIEDDEAKKGCPGCHTFILPKLHVKHRFDEETGKFKFNGSFYSCKCGALSFGDHGFNLNFKKLGLK